MSISKIHTPVAFIIFNRPTTTERVFCEIAKAKPPKLFVIADGPRPNRPGETEQCLSARAIIKRVDWDCEVLTNFSDTHMGCTDRVASGISWVFEQVSEAIILEDDCLPHQSFFRFCEELLEKYRDDERIAMISGNNFQFGRKRGEASYYFSRYTHIWGWATWRRAWQYYDSKASMWPTLREEGWLNVLIGNPSQRRYWEKIFQAVYEGRIDSWDYLWTMSVWAQGMISIIPNVNLVTNIGFGKDATHTRGYSIFANMPVEPMKFPLNHPKIILRHHYADEFTARNNFASSLLRKIQLKIYAIIQNHTGITIKPN